MRRTHRTARSQGGGRRIESLSVACLLVASAAHAGDAEPAAGPPSGESRVELVITGGSGGFSSSISEIKGPRSLRAGTQVAPVAGLQPVEAILPQSYDAAFYRNGDRILFRESSWGAADLERFLSDHPRLDRVVCRQLWLVESASELSFDFDPVRCGGFRSNSLDALARAEGLASRQQVAQLASRGRGEVVRPVIEERALSDLHWTTGRLLRLVTDGGEIAYMVDQGEGRSGLAVDPRPQVWERRFAERTRVQLGTDWYRLFSVARPWNEGSRRARLLAELGTAAGEGPIWLDAGGLVEEVQAGEPQPEAAALRRLSWRIATAHGLAAVTPGRAELSAGLAQLGREAEAAGLALVAANLKRGDVPVFQPFRVIERDRRRVAVIGLIDPALAVSLGRGPLEGAQLTDPTDAVRSALGSLLAEVPGPVDLVVVLIAATGTPRWVDQLRGVDLVFLSDEQALHDAGWPMRIEAPGRPTETHFARGRRRTPLLVRSLSRYGPETVGATFRGPGGHRDLTELHIVPRRLAESAERDREVAAGLSSVRELGRADAEVPVLPDLDPIIRQDRALWSRLLSDRAYSHLSERERHEGDFPAILTVPLWTQLVAGTMRRMLDADVALIESQPLLQVGIGPVPRAFVESNLPATRSLVRVDLPCKAATALAGGRDDLPTLAVARVSGLSDEEWCRVVMTDALWERPAVRAVAARHGIDADDAALRFRRSDGGPARFVATGAGGVLRLREAVMTGLDDRRRRFGGLGPPAEQEVAEDMRVVVRRGPRWFVDIDEASVRFESLHEPSEDARYSFRSPDRQRIEARSRVRQDYHAEVDVSREADNLHLRFGALLRYSRDDLGDDEQELRDLVRGAVELSFPVLSHPIGRGFAVTPSLLASVDTELTRPDDAAGGREDRLVLLRWTAAMRLERRRARLGRIGAFGEYDFRDDRLEAGLEAWLERTTALGERLEWSNRLEWWYYFPSNRDTARDLGMSASWRSTLRIPLVRDLAFLATADLFAFRGKVDATSKTGLSTILGFGIGYQRLRWKPGREPLLH